MTKLRTTAIGALLFLQIITTGIRGAMDEKLKEHLFSISGIVTNNSKQLLNLETSDLAEQLIKPVLQETEQFLSSVTNKNEGDGIFKKLLNI